MRHEEIQRDTKEFYKRLGTKTWEGEMIERSRETTGGREEGGGGVKIECLRNEDLND